MAIPLSKRKLSADYGITLSPGNPPALKDGTTIGGTALTAAKFTAYDAAVAGLAPATSVTYNKASFTGSPLKKTVPDEVRGVTVAAASANAVLELTLPTGATNLGDVLTLTVSLTEANPGSLNVVYGAGTLTAVANGQHTFHCTGTGVWKPMRNAAEILALQATVDTAVTGLSAVVADHTTKIGTYTGGSLTNVAADVGALQTAATNLTPVTMLTIDAMTTEAHAAYTIPNRVSLLILSDENTVEGDKVTSNITLPSGAYNIGQRIAIQIALGADQYKHVVNLVLGGGTTLSDVADGSYAFYCIAAGVWVRELVPQSGALTEFGPGAEVTGDISSYNETAFKALLTACEKAGIIADTTTT